MKKIKHNRDQILDAKELSLQSSGFEEENVSG